MERARTTGCDTNTSIRWPTSTHEKLRLAAFQRRATMNKIVNDAVTEWLERHSQGDAEPEQAASA
jgi:hypothetical protein